MVTDQQTGLRDCLTTGWSGLRRKPISRMERQLQFTAPRSHFPSQHSLWFWRWDQCNFGPLWDFAESDIIQSLTADSN